MKAKELSPGWAMTQSDPAAKLQQVINNVKAYDGLHRLRTAVEDSEFCQVVGISPFLLSIDGLKTTLGIFAAIALLCGVAEWLEGGAL